MLNIVFRNRKFSSFAICIMMSMAGHLLRAQDSVSVMKLPIEVLHAPGSQDLLVIYLTGDGGWNKFSQDLGASFVNKGYCFVALNSRKYFWDVKTPDALTKDINMLATHFLRLWKKSKVLIIGYSFGADVAAFLPTRLAARVLHQTSLLVLISASASTDFVVKLSDLIVGSDSKDRKYDVAAELRKSPLPVLCIFGVEEDLILKKELRPSARIEIEEVPGTHHYNQQSNTLVDRILTRL